MNIGYLYVGLVVIGCFVGLALFWFLIEAIMSARKMRNESLPRIHTAIRTGKLIYVEDADIILKKERDGKNGKKAIRRDKRKSI